MAVTSKTLQNNDLTLCGGLGKCLQAIEKKVENQSLSNGAGYSPTLEAICRRGKASYNFQGDIGLDHEAHTNGE
jgi:hypothetical protein